MYQTFSDHTKVKYVINCPNISEYGIPELEKLREMLATLIHANHDDILVSGVKNGCVIVTMMIRNCLIPTLKALYTSEKISMTCHWMLKLSLKHKIIKVMIQNEVIYPPGMNLLPFLKTFVYNDIFYRLLYTTCIIYIASSYLPHVDILSNSAGLTAEEELSRHVLRSSFKAKPENPKVTVSLTHCHISF